MRSSPSIVPADRLDRDVYLVLEDFGAHAGCAWRETDEQDTDRETVLRDLLSGQYAYPLRIVAFNAIEGWSRDVTEDIADALADRAARERLDLSPAPSFRPIAHAHSAFSSCYHYAEPPEPIVRNAAPFLHFSPNADPLARDAQTAAARAAIWASRRARLEALPPRERSPGL